MRDGTFIQEIENEFQEQFERTISEMRVGHPQFEKTTNTALIRMQDDLLTVKIKRRNVYFDHDKLSEFQNSEYRRALVQQLYYVLTEGDLHGISGFDLSTNTMIPREELEKRAVSAMAWDILKAAGLLYPALNRGIRRRIL